MTAARTSPGRPATAMAAVALLAALAALPGAAQPRAAAAAFGPQAAGLYGGGAVGDFLQFVSLRVRPGGRFSARATLVTACSARFGDSLTETVAVRGARLSPGGRYSSTSSFSQRIEPGVPGVGGLRAEGTIRFAARLTAPSAGTTGRARGLVRVRTTYSDPDSGRERSRCDTGRVAWAARRPPADAGTGGLAGRPAEGALLGATAQDEAFLMRVADRGRLVGRAGLTVRIGCPSTIGLPLDIVAHKLRIRRGRFGAAGSFRRPFTYPNGTEVVERYSWALRGRFGSHGVRGHFALRGVVRRRSDRRQVGSCETGAIGWRAVR